MNSIKSKLYSVLLFPLFSLSAWASEEEEAECQEGVADCFGNGELLMQIIAIAVPVACLVGAILFLPAVFARKTIDNPELSPMAEKRFGAALGIFLSVLVFFGATYGVSEGVPDGWWPLFLILFGVSIAFLVVAQMGRNKS